MLDLTKRIEDYYELIWFDGEKLQLKRPTQSMLMEIMALSEVEEPEKQLDGFCNVLYRILNHNTNKRQFTREEVDALDFEVIELIMDDYITTLYGELGE